MKPKERVNSRGLMFKSLHECSTEVDIPLQTVWNFCMNPDNWPQWIDQIESCKIVGEFKAGSTVKAKIKNRNVYVTFLITDVQPFNSCTLLIKAPLCTQTSSCTFREISHERTTITWETSIVSILSPFMKGFFAKRFESSNAKFLKLLQDNAKQFCLR